MKVIKYKSIFLVRVCSLNAFDIFILEFNDWTLIKSQANCFRNLYSLFSFHVRFTLFDDRQKTSLVVISVSFRLSGLSD